MALCRIISYQQTGGFSVKESSKRIPGRSFQADLFKRIFSNGSLLGEGVEAIKPFKTTLGNYAKHVH